jgi:hypothetical protein
MIAYPWGRRTYLEYYDQSKHLSVRIGPSSRSISASNGCNIEHLSTSIKHVLMYHNDYGKLWAGSWETVGLPLPRPVDVRAPVSTRSSEGDDIDVANDNTHLITTYLINSSVQSHSHSLSPHNRAQSAAKHPQANNMVRHLACRNSSLHSR